MSHSPQCYGLAQGTVINWSGMCNTGDWNPHKISSVYLFPRGLVLAYYSPLDLGLVDSGIMALDTQLA